MISVAYTGHVRSAVTMRLLVIRFLLVLCVVVTLGNAALLVTSHWQGWYLLYSHNGLLIWDGKVLLLWSLPEEYSRSVVPIPAKSIREELPNVATEASKQGFKYVVIPTLWIILPISIALTIWVALKARRVPPPGFCRKCRYDLRGISGACPECGAAIPGRVECSR